MQHDAAHQLVDIDEGPELGPLRGYQDTIVLTELKAEGKTIFFNSHLLPDVALLCDTVGIMYEGQLVAQESITKLSPERNAQELEKFFLEKTGGIINE